MPCQVFWVALLTGTRSAACGNIVANMLLFSPAEYYTIMVCKSLPTISTPYLQNRPSNVPNSPQNKWNESGFRPPLCTYRLNWAKRTSWGWWDDWDDTVLQTQDSKFEPWRSRPSTLPLGHGGSPQYWLSHVDGEETFLFLSNRRDWEPNHKSTQIQVPSIHE